MTTTAIKQTEQKSLVKEMANKFHVEPDKFLTTLKATAFQQQRGREITNEQMMQLLIIANTYDLNPFLKQIYAFPKGDSITPIVGVDGYIKIVNDHPQADGWNYTISETTVRVDGVAYDLPEWIECEMFRGDRRHPTVARVYMVESFRKTGPWQQYPRLMLENRAFIRAARFAYGFTGIFSEDDAERISESNQYIEAELVDKAPESEPEATEQSEMTVDQAQDSFIESYAEEAAKTE